MRQILFISLFFLNFFNAQNLKVEYDRINKNNGEGFNSVSVDKAFQNKMEDEIKKTQKSILYFMDGSTFFKNLPTPEITYTGKSEKIDANTTKINTGRYTQAILKMFHKKGDKGLYQYHNYNDDEFYHYSVPKYDKIEYKDDTELIEKYKCKLVEVTFKGKLFKIWYTEDVPVSAGPYMFNTFPGLVLKIDGANYLMYATKISNEGKKEDFETINPKFKVLNDEEFSKKWNEFMEETKKVKENHVDIRL